MQKCHWYVQFVFNFNLFLPIFCVRPFFTCCNMMKNILRSNCYPLRPPSFRRSPKSRYTKRCHQSATDDDNANNNNNNSKKKNCTAEGKTKFSQPFNFILIELTTQIKWNAIQHIGVLLLKRGDKPPNDNDIELFGAPLGSDTGSRRLVYGW